ncbi:MAG: asparagine synthetase A [Candidatus Asgardarchaeia archaeon]
MYESKLQLEGMDKELLKKIEQDLINRPKLLKSQKMKAILRIQDAMFGAIRSFMDSAGYYQVLPPIIGPVTDPGIRGAKQVSFDFYGKEWKVMSSMILYKQLALLALDKIYALSPNIRLEPMESATTGRHLVEFEQVDVEARDTTMEEVMQVAEDLIVYTISFIKKHMSEELEILGRELRVPKKPFKRYTYDEIFHMAKEIGYPFEYGVEVPWPVERKISELHKDPFWIMDYPVGSRGFYYLEDEERPGILKTMDLIYPEGFGEAISGGEREYRREKIEEIVRKTGEDPKIYKWYLDMLEEEKIRSSGFGIGFERFTRFIVGEKHIAYCGPFTKIAGIYSP